MRPAMGAITRVYPRLMRAPSSAVFQYSISARTMGDRARWREILRANRGRIDGPDELQIGQVLILPAMGGR